MKKIKVEAEVTYYVMFECEVEVPDDFDPSGPYVSVVNKSINDQVVEAAKEYDSILEVDDVDWSIA